MYQNCDMIIKIIMIKSVQVNDNMLWSSCLTQSSELGTSGKIKCANKCQLSSIYFRKGQFVNLLLWTQQNMNVSCQATGEERISLSRPK